MAILMRTSRGMATMKKSTLTNMRGSEDAEGEEQVVETDGGNFQLVGRSSSSRFVCVYIPSCVLTSYVNLHADCMSTHRHLDVSDTMVKICVTPAEFQPRRFFRENRCHVDV